MASIELLRKLIREEVRAVFQEELAGILKEAIIANKSKERIQESKISQRPVDRVPGTLNTAAKPVIAPNLGMGNPLTSLLSETAKSMTVEDVTGLSYTSADAGGFGMFQKESRVVDTVDAMMATAKPSSNFEAIQINDVPDFTNLMSNLKAKGAI